MLHSLESSLKAASPRHSPPPTPLRSYLIHGGVLLLWLGLFGMAFRFTGLLAWSTGLVYVAYDTALLVFVFWQTLSLARDRVEVGASRTGSAAALQPWVSVGVIVAAHDEATVLPVTLAALLGQHQPPDEIVIADDGSTDATADVLLRLYGLTAPLLGVMSAPSPTHPTLRWLRLPHGGKARALNAAILQMTTDTVLTVDGDTLLEPQAIGVVRDAFTAEAALVAATGVLAPVCKATRSRVERSAWSSGASGETAIGGGRSVRPRIPRVRKTPRWIGEVVSV